VSGNDNPMLIQRFFAQSCLFPTNL